MAKASRRKARQDERTGQKHEVRIDIGGRIAVIDAASAHDDDILSLLLPLLEYKQRVFEEGGSLGYRGSTERILLHDLHLGRQWTFPSGLVPRIAHALRERGYPLRVVDHRTFPKRFTVDQNFLRRLNREDRRLAKILQQEPQGQIEVTGEMDLILAMRFVVSLYSKARVLIPVTTRKMASKIYDKLGGLAIDFPVTLRGHRWPNPPPRCLICTFYAFNACRPEDWDIILLPDCRGATSKLGTGVLDDCTGAWDKTVHRVYSFLHLSEHLDPVDRILLEAISGPVIYRCAPVEAKVQVLWLPTPRCPAVDWKAPCLTFKRAAYWHNDRRNGYIAAVARAVVNRDSSKLHKYGFPFSDGEPMLRHPEHPKIVLLVASTEQARELARRLPEWPVLDAVPNNKQTKDVKKPRKGNPPPGWIVTEMRAAEIGVDADVVIRAGGGLGTCCLNEFPPMLEPQEKRDAILLDFDDKFDERTKTDAEGRRREYESLGWDVGADPVPASTKRDERG